MSAGLWRNGANAIVKGWRGPPLPTDPEEEMRALEGYRLQLHDIEDAINKNLGRDLDLPSSSSSPSSYLRRWVLTMERRRKGARCKQPREFIEAWADAVPLWRVS
jgi:hypothetical protein